MKQAIIVHCWGGGPDYCWYPQTKKELEDLGFSVQVPAMPDTENPKLDAWLSALKGVVEAPTENLYLIGHSAGCITIMRYLETLPSNTQIGGVVFVAGFTDDLGFEEIKTFFREPLDFEKIKSAAKKFVAIHSDNDPYVALRYGDILKEKLGAEVIVKNNAGHFSGPVDDEGSCLSLPEVAESIRKMPV
ncbi:MAG: alpha/beta hydrolase [Candidatus Kerfeldbacteria bacterium]